MVCSGCANESYCLHGKQRNCTTACEAGTYETVACTNVTDRVCSKCPGNSFCTGGDFRRTCRPACASGTREIVPCTNATDRVCGACPNSSYCAGGRALPCTGCGSGLCESSNCTAFADRTCETCPAVVRETLAVGNLTLQACACASGMMASTLGSVYGTQVLMLACESGEYVIACENYTCPCNASRRLLQADQPVKVVYVYRAAPIDVVLEALTKAIRVAVPDAFVQDKVATVLPTNLLNYDPTLRTLSEGLPLLWILVACCVVVIVAACTRAFALRSVVVLKSADRQFITIKMHDT